MKVGWNDDRKVYGIAVPFWLGFAITDESSRRILMLPIPINFVCACGIWVYRHIKFPRFNGRSSAEYRRGWVEGSAAGEKSGREKQKFELGRFADESLAEARSREER